MPLLSRTFRLASLLLGSGKRFGRCATDFDPSEFINCPPRLQYKPILPATQTLGRELPRISGGRQSSLAIATTTVQTRHSSDKRVPGAFVCSSTSRHNENRNFVPIPTSWRIRKLTRAGTSTRYSHSNNPSSTCFIGLLTPDTSLRLGAGLE